VTYIAGYLSYAGAAVGGATVRAHRVDDGSLEEEVVTSAGLFVFSALTTGDAYTIIAHNPSGLGNAVIWDPVTAVASLDRDVAPSGDAAVAFGDPEVGFIDWDSYTTIRLPLRVDETNYGTGTTASITGGTPVFDPLLGLSLVGVIDLTMACTTEIDFSGGADYTVEATILRGAITDGTYGDTYVLEMHDASFDQFFSISLLNATDEIFVYSNSLITPGTTALQATLPAATYGPFQIAVTREAGYLRAYVDGTLVAEGADAADLGALSVLNISVSGSPSSIREVRVLNGVAKYTGASYTVREYL